MKKTGFPDVHPQSRVYVQENFSSIPEEYDFIAEDINYLIGIISQHHIYFFYSYLIYDICRILNSNYSFNIKSYINNITKKCLENKVFNFELDNFQKIINLYQTEKLVTLNNKNLDTLSNLLKKKSKISLYIDKIRQINEDLIFIETM